MQAHKIE